MRPRLLLPLCALPFFVLATSRSYAASCTYGTLWGAVSSNLGDPTQGCSDSAPGGCDLWVYELAWSEDSACPLFVTALRRVTRTAGVGEIDARVTLGSDGPSSFAYTFVTGASPSFGYARQRRDWDTASFYGFAIASTTTLTSAPTVSRTVGHGGVVLTTSGSTIQIVGRSGLTEDVGARLLDFATAHPELGIRQSNQAQVVFFTGDFAVDTTLGQPRTRIYAALSSHNEADSTNADCQAVLGDRSTYRQMRDLTLDVGRQVVLQEGAWDLQTDWLFIQDMKAWDTAEYLHLHDDMHALQELEASIAPGRIAVEAHTHEDFAAPTHTYGDVTALLADVGVHGKGVAGGFNWEDDVEKLFSPVTMAGTLNATSSVDFNASILSFGALSSHAIGSDVLLSGVWRPYGNGSGVIHTPADLVDDDGDGVDDFFEHDAGAPLVFVSTADRNGTGAGVAQMLQLLDAGSLQQNRLYPAAVYFGHCQLSSSPTGPRESSPSDLAAVMAGFRTDVNRGALVWATLPVVVRDWREIYGAAESCVNPDGFDPVHSCGF